MDDMTTFVNLVRTMRNAQKKYFRTKDWNALMESKSAESLVDKEIQKFDERQKCGADLFSQDELPF